MPPAGLAGAPPTVANPDAGDGDVPKASPAQFSHLPRRHAGTEAGNAANPREPRQPDGLVWARYALALGLGLFAPPRGFLCFFLIDILAGVVLPWATRQRTAAGLMRAVGSWVRQVWCYWRRSWLIMVIARAAVQVFLSRHSAQTDRGRS
jgi:hypothetical protein